MPVGRTLVLVDDVGAVRQFAIPPGARANRYAPRVRPAFSLEASEAAAPQLPASPTVLGFEYVGDLPDGRLVYGYPFEKGGRYRFWVWRYLVYPTCQGMLRDISTPEEETRVLLDDGRIFAASVREQLDAVMRATEPFVVLHATSLPFEDASGRGLQVYMLGVARC